ncbi:phasin family protein [Massilia sp. IC2-477]|uniref:phasin family protein n=1 Tax=Massilia sp. IC2-477 TaxID=2887198 RepID=UPI001D12C94B|nr:phasin family protein [Massilia sp. IC2-477]MCC2957241.1 phasin family protein [Massilia sp. IC2-477]
MTSLHDQFSAVRKAQFHAQFDFFNSMTTQAIESASRVAALNLAISRDAVQRSLGTGFALMNSRDPRDVLTLGGQAEEQVRSLFAYGRELLGIASGVRPYAVRPQALTLAPQQAVETVETVEVVEQAADPAVAVAADLAGDLADTAPSAEALAPTLGDTLAAAIPAEPVVVAEAPAALDELVAEPAPVAEPKPIAKAAGKGAPRAAAAAHPAAAPVAELDATEAPKVELAPASSKRKK